MKLTVTVEDTDAARLLNLAWAGYRYDREPMSPTLNEHREDKKLLEAFRQECESAKGGKL